LYPVPFKLNYAPPHEWGQFFVRAWNSPPEFTTRHRPGTAQVAHDRIVLGRTTVEEVKDVHLKTLKLCVDVANSDFAAFVKRINNEQQKRADQEKQHRDDVQRMAADMHFEDTDVA
jgi:hypothetical protein